MKKIVLLGGTFDPVHTGHLMIAQHALKQRGASEVWFVLAKRSPFKSDSNSFEHRAAMVELMISPYRKMTLCTLEHALPDPSYSVDTVRALKANHPNWHFEWLMGSDQLDKLSQWKDVDTLNQLSPIIIYQRTPTMANHPYIDLEGAIQAVSSTDIRLGNSTQTAPAVLAYMMHQGLYLDAMIKHRLSPSRYQHTLRVTQLALELAAHHRIDLRKMTLAAMMHDYAKEMNREAMSDRIRALDASVRKLHPALYHGFIAAKDLSQYYYIKDQNVLQAISGHVSGSSTLKTAMVLYIADKCEPQRPQDRTHFVEMAKKNLTHGFKTLRNEIRSNNE